MERDGTKSVKMADKRGKMEQIGSWKQKERMRRVYCVEKWNKVVVRITTMELNDN